MNVLSAQENVIGTGSEFAFDVEGAKALSHHTPQRVLLAEDDDEMRSLLAQSLVQEGYNVTECSDGLSLLDYLDSHSPPSERFSFDLIISDIRMPGVSGLEVLEIKYECEGFPPMILITAYGDEETHTQAEQMGAAGILDKPFEIYDLLMKVREVLLTHSRGKIAFKERADSAHIQTILRASVKGISPAVDRILEFVRGMGCDSETEVDVALALHEALANAVARGCKGGSSKIVHLSVDCDESGGLSMVVRDPGPGFDHTSIPAPVEGKNIHSEHGRGIFLIKQLMDKVWFEHGGREIHMRKKQLSSNSKLDEEKHDSPNSSPSSS